MCGPDHSRRIKPVRLHLREQLLVKCFVDLRRAAQDPKIVATRFADHGVLVVRTKSITTNRPPSSLSTQV